MTAAYMTNGTWRLAFLIGVVLLFITDKAPLSQILIGAFLIGFCVLGFLFLRLKPRADLVAIHSDITKTKDVYLIGSSYFMAALSLLSGPLCAKTKHARLIICVGINC